MRSVSPETEMPDGKVETRINRKLKNDADSKAAQSTLGLLSGFNGFRFRAFTSGQAQGFVERRALVGADGLAVLEFVTYDLHNVALGLLRPVVGDARDPVADNLRDRHLLRFVGDHQAADQRAGLV